MFLSVPLSVMFGEMQLHHYHKTYCRLPRDHFESPFVVSGGNSRVGQLKASAFFKLISTLVPNIFTELFSGIISYNKSKINLSTNRNQKGPNQLLLSFLLFISHLSYHLLSNNILHNLLLLILNLSQRDSFLRRTRSL